MSITADIQSLRPGALVELFVLDATSLGGSVIRFHAGTNGLRQPVIWQGNTYSPLPVEASGFDFSGKGQLPRPSLKVANIGGVLGAEIAGYDDLIGATVTRKRTLAKYLDAANFPARRNLLTNTDALPTWGASNATAAAIADLTELGESGMVSLIESTDAGVGHYIARPAQIVAGTTYTLSVKATERAGSGKRYLSLVMPSTGFGVTSGCVFDLAAGTVALSVNAVGSMRRLANGGWRCTATATATADVASLGMQLRLLQSAASLTGGYTGDGASGINVWHPQFEAASAATDYQPIGAAWSQNPDADPNAHLPDDVFLIDRKAGENKVAIEFELAASFDVAGVQLPRRPVTQNICPWNYREVSESSACPYSGTIYWDADDRRVTDPAKDVCGKRLTSCKLRFGTEPLYFGGFPGAGMSS